MRPNFLFFTAIFGFSAVALGAFGAHALKTSLSPEMLAVYKTAVNYHIWHALALGIVAICKQVYPTTDNFLDIAGWGFCLGILLFSGSLYLLAILNLPILGMFTPLGGIGFLTAWFYLGKFAFQHNN